MTDNIPGMGTSHNGKMYPVRDLSLCARAGHTTHMLRNNIAKLRKARKLNQDELGDLIGTTGRMVGKLERGDRPLHNDWIEKFAVALEVAPFELIAPEDLFPTDEELADMLQLAQQRLPVGLPYSEWPRAVSGDLRARLVTLARDRASVASRDDRA